MSAALHKLEQRRLLDSDGVADGASIFFYLANTLTLAPIYSDAGLATPLSNPVVLGAGAVVPDIYLDTNYTYRRRIVYLDGSVEDTDPYLVEDSGLISYTGSGLGVIATTIQTKLRQQPVSVAEYSSVAEAVATGKDVFFPEGVWSFSDVAVTTADQKFFGAGPGSIIRSSDLTKHIFKVRAANVKFANLRFEGQAPDASQTTFVFFTEAAYPAPYLSISDCVFTGVDASKGFDNIAKFDVGADHGRVTRCSVERLQGNASGHGYFVLCGDVDDVVVSECSGKGSALRGRHFHYMSSGSSFCKSLGNHIDGFHADAITIFSTPAQPACVGNIVKGNTIINSASAITSGSISLAQNIQHNVVEGNTIVNSGGGGIVIDGTNSTGLCKNNHVKDNQIIDSQYIGIDIISMAGGSITNNIVNESSKASAGTYPNIRLKTFSVSEPAVSDIFISGNQSTGTTYARSAITLDPTAPVPTGISLKGNYFPMCNLANIELNGVVCAVDGVIRAQTTWDIPSTVDGAVATLSGISVPGAAQGDIVMADHAALNTGGWFLSGVVSSSNTVNITALNKTGGTVDPGSGSMTIRVRKENY